MRLLAIETATDICSVALFDGKRLLSEGTVHLPKKHAELLIMLIQQQLRNAETDLETLDAVAVSIGPGSFTGLRIGVSTAKGLIYQHNTDMLAVPTLAASAWSVRGAAEKVAVIHHSHRDYYFYAVYQVVPVLLEITGPVREELPAILQKMDTDLPVVVQAPQEKDLGKRRSLKNNILSTNAVQARYVGTLAGYQPEQWRVREPYHLEPEYLREYQAVKYQNPLLPKGFFEKPDRQT